MSRVRYVSALLGLAAAARGISLTFLRPLNWDEIEFFRASDWVRRGLVPYRDFFEHHTPLQWFLFAPVTGLIHSSGVVAIIAMRWAQVPLWIATFWLMSIWMRREGISLFARLGAIVITLCSSMFMLAAIEFRVDALACTLLALALVLEQRESMTTAGTALVLAGFANVRLGPMLVVALITFAIRHRKRVLSLASGVALALAGCASYFVFTKTTAIAWQSVIVNNYLADHWVQRTPGIFVHRLSTPLGLTASGFVASAIDPATIVIALFGLMGMIRHRFVSLTVIQIVNLLFIAVMKFVQIYHFEAAFILMIPFVALEIGHWAEREVMASLTLLVAFSTAVSIFRGKEADLQYQNRIMIEANRLTPPNSAVFDGAGWALDRAPAYHYWFLREIVRVLESHGKFETYRVDPANPPAAVISDYGARLWLATHPDLRRYVVAHYAPYWRDLWLPTMSAVIPPHAQATWIVPASGTYAIYASPALASHPWFSGKVTTYTRLGGGKPVVLQRGARYTMGSADSQPIGVFIVPVAFQELFLQPPPGVDIDGAPPPRWHVPQLW